VHGWHQSDWTIGLTSQTHGHLKYSKKKKRQLAAKFSSCLSENVSVSQPHHQSDWQNYSKASTLGNLYSQLINKIYTCVYIHIYMYMYICIHMHIFIYIYIYTHVYIHEYICMYIPSMYIYLKHVHPAISVTTHPGCPEHSIFFHSYKHIYSFIYTHTLNHSSFIYTYILIHIQTYTHFAFICTHTRIHIHPYTQSSLIHMHVNNHSYTNIHAFFIHTHIYTWPFQ